VNWPLENVRLIDTCGTVVDEWVGYLLPHYLGGLVNENSQCCYTLEFECGFILYLRPGDLGDVVWDALMVHASWCMADETPHQARQRTICPINLNVVAGMV
jgi:hypothetical protein